MTRTFDDKTTKEYNASYFNVHAPSENLLFGENLDLEIHFVH